MTPERFVMSYKIETARRPAEFLSWQDAWEQAVAMNSGTVGLSQDMVDDWVYEEGWAMSRTMGGWYRFLPEGTAR